MFAIVVAIIGVYSCAAAKEACLPERVGCFRHDAKFDHILYSDREMHEGESFHTKQRINYGNFKDYINKQLCRCERAAALKGYSYFALRDYGECHGIDGMTEGKYDKSMYCLRHDYQMCMKDKNYCVGVDEGQFIFRVTLKIKEEITNPKELKTVVFCQHLGKRSISCPSDYVIDIESAFYGRLSKDHCSYIPGYDLKCRATTSGQRIRNECNGRNKCTLNPDNSVYGNPCKDTWKYIQVQYSCIHKKEQPNLKTAIFCENAGIGTLECPEHQVLDVQSAYFGRLSKDYCEYKEDYSLDCVAPTSEQRIENHCSGKSVCKLDPSSSVYGNPCGITRKYIQVKYSCVMAFTLIRLNQAIFCQDEGPKTITCPGNTVLDVKSGYYGRLDKHFCSYHYGFDHECVSTVSQHKIKVGCNGLNKCTLNPSNDDYGNPCHGTRKYLQVNYACDPKPKVFG